ncbi:MAG: alanine-zipper protein [Pseudomonadota bacterium]
MRIQLTGAARALAVVAAAATLTGCTALEEKVDRALQLAEQASSDASSALSTANSAASAASSAQSTADQALSAANAAQRAADRANACCNANTDKIDRMFEEVTRK